MRILFVHQNYPGQFKNLAPTLATQKGHEVAALTITPFRGKSNVKVFRYLVKGRSAPSIHRWVADLETKVIRGEAAFRAALQLKQKGFTPDVIVANPGWGESLFLKEVWPKAKLGLYCEFYYVREGGDVGFDPEFQKPSADDGPRIALKNVNNLLHFQVADRGLAPTRWQASTFPEPFRSRISVIHDGIDTQLIAPRAGVKLMLGRDKRELTQDQEIITFVNRNLEPYRGYHVFMRALPEILKARPNARVIIVGGNEVSYGARAPAGKTWKQIFLDEVRGKLDMSRVHFVGKVPYPQFIALLQLSSVHVYLTYPFVLSWSLLEAMSAGKAIVASDTAPVRELIDDGKTGRLVAFHDVQNLSAQVISLLQNPQERAALGAAAREHICTHYDLRSICLPRQMRWVHELGGREGPPTAPATSSVTAVEAGPQPPLSGQAAATKPVTNGKPAARNPGKGPPPKRRR